MHGGLGEGGKGGREGGVGTGRWNEIKRGEATRLKGKARYLLRIEPRRLAARGDIYIPEEIVIDRSEETEWLCRVVLRPFFISRAPSPERNETARVNIDICHVDRARC